MPRRLLKVSRPNEPEGERALDAALAASFPASDPIAVLEPAPERSGAQPATDPLRADRRSPFQPPRKDTRP